jgi:tRNA-splicing ligase RtcB
MKVINAKGFKIKQIEKYLFEIEKDESKKMNVPARIFISEKMLNKTFEDNSLNQLVNVTKLPGIKKYAIAMPDIHEGYGFPIGCIAAFDLKNGIISPGGIGYDINCGVRLIITPVKKDEIKDKIRELANKIYENVPSGVGKEGKLKLKKKELDLVLKHGAKQIVEWGYGEKEDLENIESYGTLENANPEKVSSYAKERGINQVGTMGAGNHFVEIDFVEEIFHPISEKLTIFKDQVVFLIHTGSRGLGHQIATDYIQKMLMKKKDYGIDLPDLELACAPFFSKEGQDYFEAMQAAANFAWANRQMIAFRIKEAWGKVFGKTTQKRVKTLYDVAHNIAKIEEYKVEDDKTLSKLLVHRKGATRSFHNQPVIIPGSMGTSSWLLLGNEESLSKSFGSTCHGAGRTMSRHKAKKETKGSILKNELEQQGIVVKEGSLSGLAEEAPFAYKNVDEVIEIVHQNKIATKVAKLKPLAVIKG